MVKAVCVDGRRADGSGGRVVEAGREGVRQVPKRNTTKKFRGKGRRRVRVEAPEEPTATLRRVEDLIWGFAHATAQVVGEAQFEYQVLETAVNKLRLNDTLGILDGIAKGEERGPSTAGLVSLLAPQENDLSFRDEAILLEHDPETREGWTDNFDCEPPGDGLFIQGPNDPR